MDANEFWSSLWTFIPMYVLQAAGVLIIFGNQEIGLFRALLCGFGIGLLSFFAASLRFK